jgi:hypothetical protein
MATGSLTAERNRWDSPTLDIHCVCLSTYVCTHLYGVLANGLANPVSTMSREPCKVLCRHMRLRGGNAIIWPDRLSYDFRHPFTSS